MAKKLIKKPRKRTLYKNNLVNKNIINIKIVNDPVSKKRANSNKKRIAKYQPKKQNQPIQDGLQGYRELSIRKWRTPEQSRTQAGSFNSMDVKMLKDFLTDEMTKIKNDYTTARIDDLRLQNNTLTNSIQDLNRRLDDGYRYITQPTGNQEVRGVIKDSMYPSLYGDPSSYITYKQNEGVINEANMLDDGGNFSFEDDSGFVSAYGGYDGEDAFMYSEEPTGTRKNPRDVVEEKGDEDFEISEEGIRLYNDLTAGVYTREDIHNMRKGKLVDVMNYAASLEGKDKDYSSYKVVELRKIVKDNFAKKKSK
jgi:hypothetical protein